MKYALYILTALQVIGFVSSFFITGNLLSSFNDSAKGFLYMAIVWSIYFATRYIFTKFSKREFSLQAFRGWLFRDDLNLQNRWWHRLIKIVFFIVLLSVLYNEISDTVKQFEIKKLNTSTFEDLGFKEDSQVGNYEFGDASKSVSSAVKMTQLEYEEKYGRKPEVSFLSKVRPVTPQTEEYLSFEVLKIILFDLFWFLVAVIFYYKVFLYIIFGSKK